MKGRTKSIRNLHKLETLSLEDTNCLVLPQGAENLKKLSHIIIWKYLHGLELSFRTSESIEPFVDQWCLEELRTLHSVRASKVFVKR